MEFFIRGWCRICIVYEYSVVIFHVKLNSSFKKWQESRNRRKITVEMFNLPNYSTKIATNCIYDDYRIKLLIMWLLTQIVTLLIISMVTSSTANSQNYNTDITKDNDSSGFYDNNTTGSRQNEINDNNGQCYNNGFRRSS